MTEEYLIPIAKPKLPTFDQLEPLIRKIDFNRHYTNAGPIVNAYERTLASFFEIPEDRVVTMSNATLALQACVQTSKIETWVTQNFTFAASGLAILQAGKKLILCEVDPSTWQLDTSEFKKIPGWQNLGLMPVLPFGSELDILQFSEFEEVVFDAAASLGAPNESIKNITQSWKVVFSLHATKVLPSGEGAFVICGSAETADKLRAWANFGFNKERTSESIGTNAKMSEYSAAVGLTSFNLQKQEKLEWETVNNFAKKIDSETGWGSFVGTLNGFRPYWISQFPNLLTRNKYENELKQHGIQSRRWWSAPLSNMPVFSSCKKYGPETSQDLANRTLGLPMYRDLSPVEFERIKKILNKVLD